MTGDIDQLRTAVAEYFDVDPEVIKGFVLGLELGEGAAFHSVWQASSHWQINGWLEEMLAQQRNRREQNELLQQQQSNGEVEL